MVVISNLRFEGFVALEDYVLAEHQLYPPTAARFVADVDGVEQFALLPVEPGTIVVDPPEPMVTAKMTAAFKHFEKDHGGCSACTRIHDIDN